MAKSENSFKSCLRLFLGSVFSFGRRPIRLLSSDELSWPCSWFASWSGLLTSLTVCINKWSSGHSGPGREEGYAPRRDRDVALPPYFLVRQRSGTLLEDNSNTGWTLIRTRWSLSSKNPLMFHHTVTVTGNTGNTGDAGNAGDTGMMVNQETYWERHKSNRWHNSIQTGSV